MKRTNFFRKKAHEIDAKGKSREKDYFPLEGIVMEERTTSNKIRQLNLGPAGFLLEVQLEKEEKKDGGAALPTPIFILDRSGSMGVWAKVIR